MFVPVDGLATIWMSLFLPPLVNLAAPIGGLRGGEHKVHCTECWYSWPTNLLSRTKTTLQLAIQMSIREIPTSRFQGGLGMLAFTCIVATSYQASIPETETDLGSVCNCTSVWSPTHHTHSSPPPCIRLKIPYSRLTVGCRLSP